MIAEVNIIKTDILSDNWYTLKKVTFDIRQKNGSWHTQSREAYDRGNGAAILLYNPVQKTIILTNQFRLPTYINNNPTGMLIEVCAGLLDEDNPEECIRRETEEETGFRVKQVTKIFEAYMSPGSVTEMLHFFVAEYDESQRVNTGGGIEHEQEEIEVLELDFEAALKMIETGEIKDGKTIILLYHALIHKLLS